MTLLELLAPATTYPVQQRGASYVAAVGAAIGGLSGVTAQVEGTDTYDVSLRVEPEALVVSCTCPYFFDRGVVCKHLWAVALVAENKGWLRDVPTRLPVVADLDDGFLDDDEGFDDDLSGSPLDLVSPRRGTTGPPAWATALARVVPTPRPQFAAVGAATELLYVITVPPHATVSELPIQLERRTRRRNGTWGKPQAARVTTDAIDTLPDSDDRWALSLLHSTSPYPSHAWTGNPGAPIGPTYLRRALLTHVLPRLCATGRVLLRQAPGLTVSRARSDADVTIAWDAGPPWEFRVAVTGHRDAEYAVEGVLVRGDTQVPLRRFALLMDGVAILDSVASGFEVSEGRGWIPQLRSGPPLVMPGEAWRALREALARSGVPVVAMPDDLSWDERSVPPHPRLNVGRPHPYSGGCELTLSFDYDGTTAPDDGAATVFAADGEVLYRRDRNAERDAVARLSSLGVTGLDGQSYTPPAINHRRLPGLVQALVSEGWHVEAEGVRYAGIGTPRLRIRSGIDWFELDAATEDGLVLDLPAVLKGLAKGQKTITLGDGSIGVLPEAWLARVAPLIALGEGVDERVRFRPSQAALVDAMLAAQPEVDWDEGFVKAREALQRFAGIEPEDAPPTFRGQLRGYQREALGWCRFLRDFGFGGCLADDMGLGKTVVVLALLEARRLDPTRPRTPSLVVLPRSLLFNWMHEAARFAPELRVLDFARADRHSALEAIADADVVLTTYGTLRRDVARLQSLSFDYVILDEAQAVKNESTATAKAVRLLPAAHRLALTGTPIENHVGELYSLFEFLNPGLLGSGRVLDQPRGIPRVDDAEQLEQLARGLRPFILRRTKEQVAPELPSRTEETLYCELEGKERRQYDELRDHYRTVLLGKIDREGVARSRFAILEALLRLRQAACHTGLLRGGATVATSAKFELLLPRLAELMDEGRKALVFSQFTTLLGLLRTRLDTEGIAYEYLDGQTRDRAAAVARFQDDPACPLFLISLKAGGVGLNLTAAEYVFLLDPWWNPAAEAQAIDRTHRIGQTKAVFAYRIVARDTVEERILELQASKRALADAILGAGTGGLRGLNRETLAELLS